MLSKLPNRRAIFSWGLYDLANQSFALLINTLLFSLFLKEAVLAGDQRGDLIWSLMGSVSLALVVLLGPVLGAIADVQGSKKKFLVGSGFLCAGLTCGLALIPIAADSGIALSLMIAVALYVPANLAFNIGENFLGSFLPEISSRETMGKVSAFGWTMGFVGAFLLLALTAAGSVLFQWNEPSKYRPLLFFAGVWFLVMMLPTIRYLPEGKAAAKGGEGRGALVAGFRQLGRTAKEMGRYRDLSALLLALFIYGMGMQVVVFFAGVIARDDFGFSTTYLLLFSAVVTLTGGIGAAVTGLIQDRIGHKPTLLLFLGIWLLTAGGMAALSHFREVVEHPEKLQWAVWLIGNGLGLGLGGTGTATRATVGVFTPAPRTGEFFNLWGACFKLAGVVGLPVFGFVRTLWGSVPSLLVLTSFFGLGAVMLVALVRVERGIATAEEAESPSASPK
ncbi:MAG: MFS transporter [Verrucomicrobiota bacterium]